MNWSGVQSTGADIKKYFTICCQQLALDDDGREREREIWLIQIMTATYSYQPVAMLLEHLGVSSVVLHLIA